MFINFLVPPLPSPCFILPPPPVVVLSPPSCCCFILPPPCCCFISPLPVVVLSPPPFVVLSPSPVVVLSPPLLLFYLPPCCCFISPPVVVFNVSHTSHLESHHNHTVCVMSYPPLYFSSGESLSVVSIGLLSLCPSNALTFFHYYSIC